MTQTDASLVGSFYEFVRSEDFPCLGAKSALSHDQVQVQVLDDIACPHGDEDLLQGLQRFSREQSPTSPIYQSFVVLYRSTRALSEEDFERHLWALLQRLHDLDRRDYPWDPTVSKDPTSPFFSMSLGGKAYYVIGMHPGSSRTARRFPHCALTFNLHEQFERLRASGQYDRIREAILQRDTALDGCPNPMLRKYGEASEAAQYSGRAVDASWECPFKAR